MEAKTTPTNEDFELKLYKLSEDEFIGTIDIPENATSKETVPEIVIVIDRSGSMLDSVRRLTHEILPIFLSKLSYDNQHIVHLVYFHSEAESFSLRVEEIENLSICAEGGTVMSQGIQTCQKIFHKFEKRNHKPIRLLTISDGEVQDLEETREAASDFARYLKEHGFFVNSQAIRLFTTDGQPDTTGLCSLLQVNNTTKPQVVDIKTSDSNESIAKKMANLFQLDNLSDARSLVAKSNVLYKFPWLSSPSSKLILVPGKNIFWLKTLPDKDDFKVQGKHVKIISQGSLSLAKFQSQIESQLFSIVDHMKVLKIVGTKEANMSIQQIVSYFEETEAKLAQKSFIMKLFNIESKEEKISRVLALIAEDGSVEKLNMAERAAYLRDDRKLKSDLGWIKTIAMDFRDEIHVTPLRYSFIAFFAGAAAYIAFKTFRR